VLQFALAKIGAVLVTANTLRRAKDIDYLLRQSEASTIVTIRGFRDLDYVDALDEIGAASGKIPHLQRLILIAPDGDPASRPMTRCDGTPWLFPTMTSTAALPPSASTT
jgi:acyl-coenzyme A synthetase/AMP-(fatty) acid ligase